MRGCGTKWKNAVCKTAIMLLLVCVSVLDPGNLPEAAAADKISDTEGQSWDAAADQAPYFDGWVQDDAGLLTSDEEKALESECRRLFKIYGTGVYIVTTPNFGGGDIKDWQIGRAHV